MNIPPGIAPRFSNCFGLAAYVLVYDSLSLQTLIAQVGKFLHFGLIYSEGKRILFYLFSEVARTKLFHLFLRFVIGRLLNAL